MLVASNRGPVRFVADPDAPGGYRAVPAAGGVASALRPLLVDGGTATPVTWVAVAASDDDRAATAAGASPVVHGARAGDDTGADLDLVLLDLDPDVARRHYDEVSNAVLWFLYHGMFDHVSAPTFDVDFTRAWAAYTEVNRAFADALAARAAPDDVVLVQDYHLALTPGMLRAARPDLRIAHFTHTPFCGPNSIRTLPDAVASELLASMASVPCGFHTDRWARSYAASVREVLGADTEPVTFTAPLGPDPAALAALAATPAATAATAELDRLIGDRAAIVRVDRVEPSKNIARGFVAYDRLLADHPEWRERVVFVALLNASRETVPAYVRYAEEVAAAAAAVNARWATPTWQPVVVDTRDDYPRSIAGLARADVVMVNPIRDGLNLVAKEAPIVSTRDAVLCCSPEAGSYAELAGACLEFHPFDVAAGATALHAALTMGPRERAERAARLRSLAAAHSPQTWLDAQIAAARAPRG